MKINKKEFQKALEIVKPGLANKELIEQSTSFAFLDNKVITYNDSISLSHPVEQLDLKGAIRANELYEFLKRVDKEHIKIKNTGDEIKLRVGNGTASIKLKSEVKLPIDELGNVPETDWKDLPEEFNSDIDFIKDSASGDMSRRVLTCVNVKRNMMIASDSFQVMRLYMDSETEFPYPNTLIPAENVSDIIKINPTQVYKTDGWLHFKNLEGTRISCRILVDDYPDTDKLFGVEGEKVVFPDRMPEILDKAMVFTKEDHLMDEEMQIKLKGNKLQVYGKNEYGSFKEKAPVKYDGKSASIWITPHLLKNILERSNTCELGDERIMFEGEGWEYVAVLRSQ